VKKSAKILITKKLKKTSNPHHLASFQQFYQPLSKEMNQKDVGCMQCHLIFSFEWNLIFRKSIHFFHQLTN